MCSNLISEVFSLYSKHTETEFAKLVCRFGIDQLVIEARHELSDNDAFDKCRLRRACAVSFLRFKLQMIRKRLNIPVIFKRLAKARIRLRICAVWSEPLLVAYTTLLEISCRGSIIFILSSRALFIILPISFPQMLSA